MLRLARWESQLGLLRLLPRQLYSFAKGQKNMEVTYYDSPHYFYHYQTKEVIRSIEEFIQETTD